MSTLQKIEQYYICNLNNNELIIFLNNKYIACHDSSLFLCKTCATVQLNVNTKICEELLLVLIEKEFICEVQSLKKYNNLPTTCSTTSSLPLPGQVAVTAATRSQSVLKSYTSTLIYSFNQNVVLLLEARGYGSGP